MPPRAIRRTGARPYSAATLKHRGEREHDDAEEPERGESSLCLPVWPSLREGQACFCRTNPTRLGEIRPTGSQCRKLTVAAPSIVQYGATAPQSTNGMVAAMDHKITKVADVTFRRVPRLSGVSEPRDPRRSRPSRPPSGLRPHARVPSGARTRDGRTARRIARDAWRSSSACAGSPSLAAVMLVGESGTGKEVAAAVPACAQHARRSGPFVERELRRHPGEPGRSRAVRLRARRVHRRRAPASRATSSARPAERCSSTRSPRCRSTCRRSCCACSKPAAWCRVGGDEEIADRRPRSSRPPIARRKPSCASAGCARTFLSPGGISGAPAAAARGAATISSCWRSAFPGACSTARTARTKRFDRMRAGARRGRIRGPATSASSRTASSAATCCADDARRARRAAASGTTCRTATATSANACSCRSASTMADAERELLLATLRHCGGNKRRTADVLGVSLKDRLQQARRATATSLRRCRRRRRQARRFRWHRTRLQSDAPRAGGASGRSLVAVRRPRVVACACSCR